MEGLKIVKTSLTKEVASDIMQTACDAGNHGIGQWAKVIRYGRAKAIGIGTTGRKQDGPLEWILIEDFEADDKPAHRVTRSKIAKAVDAILRDPQGTEAVGWAERLISYDTPDGPLADAIVQVACYGKVVYS